MPRYNDIFTNYGEINMGDPDILNELYKLCYPEKPKKKSYKHGKHSIQKPNKITIKITIKGVR